TGPPQALRAGEEEREEVMNALVQSLVGPSGSAAVSLYVWSWQALVLLGAAWLLVRFYRSESPALRHQVWLCGLVGTAALPLLVWLVQSIPLPASHASRLTWVIEMPRTAMEAATAPPAHNQPASAYLSLPDWLRLAWSLLFFAWLAGLVIQSVRLAGAGAALRRIRRNAVPATPADLGCAECETEAIRSGRVSVRLSSELHTPMLAGLLRPLILLPADIVTWATPEERSAMLRHELAHFERQDHIANAIQTLIRTIFYFHPLVRYACRQLGLERELACDDRVVLSGAPAATYAESLIKVAERGVASLAPENFHQPALFTARQFLERRIEMIMNDDRVRTTSSRWPYLLLPLCLLGAIVWLLVPARQTAAQENTRAVGKAAADESPYRIPPGGLAPLPGEVAGMPVTVTVATNGNFGSYCSSTDSNGLMKNIQVGFPQFTVTAEKGYGKDNWIYLPDRYEVESEGKVYYGSGPLFIRHYPGKVEIRGGLHLFRNPEFTGGLLSLPELLETMSPPEEKAPSQKILPPPPPPPPPPLLREIPDKPYD